MAKNVNRTARLQWKVDTIKNCIYLQCTVGSYPAGWPKTEILIASAPLDSKKVSLVVL